MLHSPKIVVAPSNIKNRPATRIVRNFTRPRFAGLLFLFALFPMVSSCSTIGYYHMTCDARRYWNPEFWGSVTPALYRTYSLSLNMPIFQQKPLSLQKTSIATIRHEKNNNLPCCDDCRSQWKCFS